MVPWKALNGMKRHTEQCTQGEYWKIRILAAEEEEREVTERAFSAYGLPLEMVTSFKYLGRVIFVTEYDWPEVVNKLARASKL